MQKGDVIYRQQAIDVLDVGKELLSCALDNMDIVGNDREKFEWGLGLIESYIDDIKDIPSAQQEQPEIIRCKDCKYRDDDFCIGRGYPNSLVPDDGFCDKGKRSKNGCRVQ